MNVEHAIANTATTGWGGYDPRQNQAQQTPSAGRNTVNISGGKGHDTIDVNLGGGKSQSEPLKDVIDRVTSNPDHTLEMLVQALLEALRGNGQNSNPDGNNTINIDGGNGHDTINANLGGTGGNTVNIDGGNGHDTITVNGGSITTPSESPVAANETGTITGDPHFKGGDGGKYDVQGESGKSYDLLSDSGLQFNGRFDAWGDKGATVVGETGLTVAGEDGSLSQITFDKSGKATVNGEVLSDGQSVTLADGGSATLNGDKFTVETAEGYKIVQEAKAKNHANGGYINTTVTTGENGVGNGNMPTGLLGQTFDADNDARDGAKGFGAQGEGAIDGDVTDYEVINTFDVNEKNFPGNGSNSILPGEHQPSSPNNVNVDGGRGHDTIILDGFTDKDNINVTGGKGHDTLGGSDGNETYNYAKGDGHDTISAKSSGGHDVLNLEDINLEDVSFTQDGDNLILNIKGGGSITIEGQFTQGQEGTVVDEIKFADGELTSLPDIIDDMTDQGGSHININGGNGHDNITVNLGNGGGNINIDGGNGHDDISVNLGNGLNQSSSAVQHTDFLSFDSQAFLEKLLGK